MNDSSNAEDLGFRSIQRMPAAAGEVINRIKSMILEGRLLPFQKLPSEKDLADALGVSRPTVREAVRGLMTLNIVESRHGDGTYVTSLEPGLLTGPIDFLLRIDERGLAALMDARLVLESGVAELAASRATAADVDRIARLTTEYEARIDDVQQCIELDLAFHQALAAAANSPILTSLVSTMAALGLQSRTRTAHSPRMRATAHGDYVDITQALTAHDPVRARTAMVHHLIHVQDSAVPSQADEQPAEVAQP